MRIFILVFSFLATALSLNAQDYQSTLYGNYVGIGGGQNTFFGYNIANNTTGSSNCIFGAYSGKDNTSGWSNSFFGVASGEKNTEGFWNVFMGNTSGNSNTTGAYNTMIGVRAGYSNTTANANTYLGFSAGYSNQTGRRNVYIGHEAGSNNAGGSENIFIGHKAGIDETGSGKLYIDNNSTSSPLIYGDFYNDELAFNGTVRIGNVNQPAGYQLYVEEGILTEKVIVATHGTTEWADYVFEEDYDRNTTAEVEAFIKYNKHLPNVPSAAEVNKKGVNVVEMDAALLRQIEELWLHVIELKKELEAVKK